MIENPQNPSSTKQSVLHWVTRNYIGLFLFLVFVTCIPIILHSWNEIEIADDAYYYIKPAWNFWEYGFVTFDGLTYTNGFHPLWMLILIIVALPLYIIGQYGAVLYVTVLLSFLIVVAIVYLTIRILRLAGVPTKISLVTASLTTFLLIDTLSGLEGHLVILMSLLLIHYLQQVMSDKRPFHTLIFASLCWLVLMSRLDTGIFLLLLYVTLIPFLGLRKLIISGVVLSLLAVPYFAHNYIAMEHVTPISGRVKTYWSLLDERLADGTVITSVVDLQDSNLTASRVETIGKQIERDMLYAYQNLTLRIRNLGGPRTTPLFAGILLISTLGLMIINRHRLRKQHYLLFGVVISFFSAYLIQLIYYTFRGYLIYPWYTYAAKYVLVVLATTGLILLIDILFHRRLRIIWPVVAFVMLGASFYHATTLQADQERNHAIFSSVEWLKANTSPDEVIGAWGAGRIGYFSKRQVVNLEGLIADQTVLDANYDVDIPRYLVNSNMKYVIGFFDADPLLEQNCRYNPNPFIDLTARPVLDFRNLYNLEATYDGPGNNRITHILQADLPVLASALEQRDSLQAELDRVAYRVPAESYVTFERASQTIYWRATNDFAVIGDDMRYALNTIPAGDYRMIARVYSATDDASLTVDDTIYAPEESCNWSLIDLGPRTIDAESVVSVSSHALWVDEFYLVADEDEVRFSEIQAELAEFWEEVGDYTP